MVALAGAGGAGTSDLPAAPATGKAPVPWPFQKPEPLTGQLKCEVSTVYEA